MIPARELLSRVHALQAQGEAEPRLVQSVASLQIRQIAAPRPRDCQTDKPPLCKCDFRVATPEEES